MVYIHLTGARRRRGPGALGRGFAASGAEEERGQPCANVLFLCGMSARGRTEFFHPIVAHLASLRGASGRPLLTCAHKTHLAYAPLQGV